MARLSAHFCAPGASIKTPWGARARALLRRALVGAVLATAWLYAVLSARD